MKFLTSAKFVILLIAVLLSSTLLVFAQIQLQAEAEQKSAEIRRQYGVNIHYNYNRESFFHDQPLGRGSQAWFVPSILSVVERFLSKYPKEVIHKNLSGIFLLGKLEFNGKEYGATYIDSMIYISTGGFLRYHDSVLLALMHAEFSSILFHNNNFPTDEWEAINKPGWRYIGSGFEVLGHTDRYDHTDELFENGFLDGYSQASLEEDFNAFASRVFTMPNQLRTLASKYERVRRKYELVVQFYQSIDARIDVPHVGN